MPWQWSWNTSLYGERFTVPSLAPDDPRIALLDDLFPDAFPVENKDIEDKDCSCPDPIVLILILAVSRDLTSVAALPSNNEEKESSTSGKN